MTTSSQDMSNASTRQCPAAADWHAAAGEFLAGWGGLTAMPCSAMHSRQGSCRQAIWSPRAQQDCFLTPARDKGTINWLPVWLPHFVSAANLQQPGQPEIATPPAMRRRERSMTVSPLSSREGSGVSRGETLRRSTVRHRPVFQVSLPATAAPSDRCEYITGSGTRPGSTSSRPVMHVMRVSFVRILAGCAAARSSACG
jgi:hypothetical protein